MSFVSTVCPHCGKEIQIPDDAENIVCMYCTQQIDVKVLLNKSVLTSEDYERLMKEAESLLTDEIFSRRIQLKNFKQKNYKTDFDSYLSIIRPAIEKFCLAATENDEAADYFAGILFDRFVKQFESEGILKESDPRFFDCRYMIVAFTIPAILEYQTPAAEALADSFLAKWNGHYPKNKLGKSRFDDINEGFRKKLCFITTATCICLGKGDDCEELNTFRRFRDGWLAQTASGKSKISEYYLFAPMIVRAIDHSQEKETVYREIWEKHLAPCYEMIKSGKPDQCAAGYERMVLDLESKWLNKQ